MAPQVPLSDEEKNAQEQTPEKLAIGGEKGFQVDAATENIVKHSELVLLSGNNPMVTVPLPCNDLPELVLNAIKAIQVCPCVAAMSAVMLVSCELRCATSRALQHVSDRQLQCLKAAWLGKLELLTLNCTNAVMNTG